MKNALIEKIQKGFEWLHTVPPEWFEYQVPDVERKYWRELSCPVREGIRNNDMEVLTYLEHLTPKDQLEIFTAIERGLEDQQKSGVLTESSNDVYDRAMRLYRKIAQEHGHTIRI